MGDFPKFSKHQIRALCVLAAAAADRAGEDIGGAILYYGAFHYLPEGLLQVGDQLGSGPGVTRLSRKIDKILKDLPPHRKPAKRKSFR